MYTTAQLVTLATAYLQSTGIAPSRLGMNAANNDRLFHRLFQGKTCTAKAAEKASTFFDTNWPAEAVWPPDVPRQS